MARSPELRGALSANLLAPPDGNVTDIASLLHSLRDWMAANEAAVKKFDLVIGFGYDIATLAESRHPTRNDLDAVSAAVPILLVHQSGYLLAVKSKALTMVGIAADTPDPEGGVMRRRAGGREPDGVLDETAGFPVVGKLLGRLGEAAGMTFLQIRVLETIEEGKSVFRLNSDAGKTVHERSMSSADHHLCTPGSGFDPTCGEKRLQARYASDTMDRRMRVPRASRRTLRVHRRRSRSLDGSLRYRPWQGASLQGRRP